MKPTILVVDIRHWLDDAGQLPEGPVRLRQQALRIARLIEYAATLRPKTMGETPVECSRRPGRKRCMCLLWVEKLTDNRINAWCPACGADEIFISGWEHTPWASGPMDPEPALDANSLH